MTIPAPSAAPGSYPKEGEMRWSKSERAFAQEVFDRALNQELQEVIQPAKKTAAEIKQASELWELERYLTQRRKEINRKYEYRASKLSYVFGTLLHEGRLTEHELRGLREDKLEAIRSDADFLRRSDDPI